MITNLDKYSFPTPNGGLLLSSQDCPNGNMVGYTAQLLFLAKDRIPEEMYHKYTLGLEACEYNNVYSRYPNNPENTSVDDYLALCCIPEYAQRLHLEGIVHFGFFDVHFPKVSFNAFLFRFQGLWQHMKVGAGHLIGPVGRAIWAASVYLAAKEPFGNQDNWLESHLMVETYKRSGKSSFLMDLACNFWYNKKGDMKTSEIFAKYCNIPDHPLVQAWEPYK